MEFWKQLILNQFGFGLTTEITAYRCDDPFQPGVPDYKKIRGGTCKNITHMYQCTVGKLYIFSCMYSVFLVFLHLSGSQCMYTVQAIHVCNIMANCVKEGTVKDFITVMLYCM